jgi:tetratricopeptide (TPR) repeat protein
VALLRREGRAVIRALAASLAALACAILAGSPPARADTLALKDGRFVDGKQIEKTKSGYRIHLVNGQIDVAADLVQDYFRTDDSGAWLPQTDEEKAKAEKGLAPWRGSWIKASRRKRLAQKEVEARRERMEQAQARRKWRNRAIVKSKRFTFEHTLPDHLFREFQDLFETYYEVFTKAWKIRPSKNFGKAVINIYHDAEYFHQVSGAPEGVLGYYHPKRRDLHFYYDKDRHDFTIDVMFHEGNHMLTHMIDEKVWYPAWINEGLAEYYGASTWDPRTKTMETGGIQSGRLCVLWSRIKDDKWQKLEDLIRTRRVDATQYAWAWSFCHFLMSTPKYEKNFKKFYMALGKSSKVKRTPIFDGMVTIEPDEQILHLKKYLKVKDLEELEAEWHDYIKSALALDRVEIDYAGAGWIMQIYGEYKMARKFFKKAIEAGNATGFTHYSYASMLYDRGQTEEAADLAYKATQLDPLHARSWFLLGLCHERKNKAEEGARLIRLAAELDPDDTRIWLHQAMQEELEPAK